jgi:hypothetical protein
MWMTPFLALWASSAPVFAAEPVFVPDFTPGSGAEFAVSVMLQGLVFDRFLKHDYILLTGDVVGRVLGAEAVTNCASRPGCPVDLLPRVPAQLAVVVAVTRAGDGLVGNVKIYQPGGTRPVEELFLPIEGGQEAKFADAIVTAADGLIAKLGPSPDPVITAAARMIAGQTAPDFISVPTAAPRPVPAPLAPAAPATVAPPAPAPAPSPPRPPRREASQPHVGDLDEVLEGTGYSHRHLLGVEAQFRQSGAGPREWAARNMPHAGRVAFEIRSGVGFGDVDRVARVAVATSGGETVGSWYAEGPAASRRVRGDLYVGYAPLAALDLGVLTGIQYGQRAVDTEVLSLSPTGEVTASETFDTVVVQAIQVYVQPRVRVYLIPLGPVKPYLLTGVDFRIFDDYEIVQPQSISYPQPVGGVIPGWHGGGGLMIDPVPVVGAFVEGGYTRHFGRFSAPQENTAGTWTQDSQSLAGTQQITVSVVGGLQFRL